MPDSLPRPVHRRLIRLIGALAQDVYDERRLDAHIRDVCVDDDELVEVQLMLAVARRFGLDGADDGSYTPERYLTHLHTVQGMPHAGILNHLREMAAETDPDAESHNYGAARRVGVADMRRYAGTAQGPVE